MRPNKEVTNDCYQLVRDVAGKVNDEGGIEIATEGQFKDLIHKLETYFIKRYREKNES
jgi:hypothetical protein